jgi:hypothetical protein
MENSLEHFMTTGDSQKASEPTCQQEYVSFECSNLTGSQQLAK